MSTRSTRRSALLQARDAFAKTSDFGTAALTAADCLADLLETLEPDCLGVYWPVRSEFNLGPVIDLANRSGRPLLALPYTEKPSEQRAVAASDDRAAGTAEASMSYRFWNGQPPTIVDACRIPASGGALVVPDVVLVPCVGFTRSAYRLGYGGGYFDRWLALNPHVTSIGIAWSGSEMSESDFAAEPHDVALSLVVTERGVVG